MAPSDLGTMPASRVSRSVYRADYPIFTLRVRSDKETAIEVTGEVAPTLLPTDTLIHMNAEAREIELVEMNNDCITKSVSEIFHNGPNLESVSFRIIWVVHPHSTKHTEIHLSKQSTIGSSSKSFSRTA